MDAAKLKNNTQNISALYTHKSARATTLEFYIVITMGRSRRIWELVITFDGRVLHTYPDLYKVTSQNHSSRQFWRASIPPSLRHKHNSCFLFAPVGSSGHHSPQFCDVLKNFHFWCKIEHFYYWAGMLAQLKQILAQYFILFFPDDVSFSSLLQIKGVYLNLI